MKALVLAALLASACSKYAHVATHNAPAKVDLSAPLPGERGDPDGHAGGPGTETTPGTETLAVIVMPSLMIGSGRYDAPGPKKAFGEFGLEMRFERHVDDRDDEFFSSRAWAITAGIGFAQFADRVPTHVGPVFGELSYRFPSIRSVVPTDIGIGPVFYSEDAEVGGQISVRFPLMFARARFMPRSGPEIWIGYELPFPFLFQRSR